MFWNLLLAHFTADFLLQTDWMVRNRDKFWVSILHGSTHFGMMLLLIGQARAEYWLIVFVIALIHTSQDAIKITLVRKHPDWTVPAFVLDQILHFGFIWVSIWGFQLESGTIAITQKTAWVMVAISYLFVTYVWFASERIFNLSKPDYVLNINETKYSRMLTRVGLVSIFQFVRSWVLPGLAVVLTNPYSSSKYRQRFLLTDIGISFFAMIFLVWALG